MTTKSAYRFDDAYREVITLADGTTAVVRLVQPADRDLLRRGFQELSSTSRYLRFFSTKADLTDRELAQLTELDHVNEFALGALREGPDGSTEGLGVARFVRDPDQPEMAEAAVTVTDAAQGLGLGTGLLIRLAEAARERGVTCFSGEFLATNDRVRALIEETCPDARLVSLGETIRAEVPLGGPDAPASAAPVQQLLRHVAGGRLALRLRHLLLKGN